jgi:hypothetical protein
VTRSLALDEAGEARLSAFVDASASFADPLFDFGHGLTFISDRRSPESSHS